MTDEHAYAYEAGYVDGSTHYELEHCPACKNVADLQAALDENAKLRELISLMAVRWLPNDVRMTPDKWHERDERIRGKLLELRIEVKDD